MTTTAPLTVTLGAFTLTHRTSAAHPAGLYYISHKGVEVGRQFSLPNLDDCVRLLKLHEQGGAPTTANPARAAVFEFADQVGHHPRQSVVQQSRMRGAERGGRTVQTKGRF